jgi:hypothetical protein
MSSYFLAELAQKYDAEGLLGKGHIAFSIFGTVRNLREQRIGSVQTLEQYMFIHGFLKDYLEKIAEKFKLE